MKGAVPIAWEKSCVPVTGRKTIAFYIHKKDSMVLQITVVEMSVGKTKYTGF